MLVFGGYVDNDAVTVFARAIVMHSDNSETIADNALAHVARCIASLSIYPHSEAHSGPPLSFAGNC